MKRRGGQKSPTYLGKGEGSIARKGEGGWVGVEGQGVCGLEGEQGGVRWRGWGGHLAEDTPSLPPYEQNHRHE